MRVQLAILLMMTTPAMADMLDFELLIDLANKTHHACRLGAIPEPALTKACESRDVYWQSLVDAGYCFDRSEQEWIKCKED